MLDKPDLSVYLSKSEEFLNEGMNMNVMARVGAFKQSDISRNRHEKVVVSMQSRRCEWTHGKSTLPTHGTKSFAELGGD